MKNDKNKPYEEPDDFIQGDEFNSVVSATECTGLMSIPPQNEEEEESYADIYTVPNQVKKSSKDK